MNAEDLITSILSDPEDIFGEPVNQARIIVKALREAGILLEWREDMENAPLDEFILAYDGYSVRSVERLRDRRWHETGSAGFVPERFAIIKPPEQTND